MTKKNKQYWRQLAESLGETIEDLQEEIDFLKDQCERHQRNILAERERAQRYHEIYKNLLGTLPKDDINGWYWHIEKKAPVYVKGLTAEGYRGFIVHTQECMSTVGTTSSKRNVTPAMIGYFLPEKLVRIDKNIEFQL